MQLFVAPLGLIYVPILKNASRALANAISQRWGDVQAVLPHFPGARVVMWRDPVRRIESTYRMMRQNGMDQPFALWSEAVCTEGLRDPHLQLQLSFCDNPMHLFRWDFGGFRRLFKIREPIARTNQSEDIPLEWTDRARAAFERAYAADLRIWHGHRK